MQTCLKLRWPPPRRWAPDPVAGAAQAAAEPAVRVHRPAQPGGGFDLTAAWPPRA